MCTRLSSIVYKELFNVEKPLVHNTVTQLVQFRRVSNTSNKIHYTKCAIYTQISISIGHERFLHSQ